MNLFPPVRISELKADAERKREQFLDRAVSLKSSVRANASPWTFLKEHPQMIIGAIASSYTLLKLLGRFIPGSSKKSSIIAGLMSNVVGGMMGMGGRVALKAFMPLISGLFKFLLKTALKKD